MTSCRGVAHAWGVEEATHHRGMVLGDSECQRTVECGHSRTSEKRPRQVGVLRHP